jgi:hypothetical protein
MVTMSVPAEYNATQNSDMHLCCELCPKSRFQYSVVPKAARKLLSHHAHWFLNVIDASSLCIDYSSVPSH